MTVKELIERLKLMPSDAKVIYNNYEDSYAPNPEVKVTDLKHFYWTEEMEGDFIEDKEVYVQL